MGGQATGSETEAAILSPYAIGRKGDLQLLRLGTTPGQLRPPQLPPTACPFGSPPEAASVRTDGDLDNSLAQDRPFWRV